MNHLATILMSDEEKKYLQAKCDIVQARKSFDDLTQAQQKRLLSELLWTTAGSEIGYMMYNRGK